jgi:hypothetical protein
MFTLAGGHNAPAVAGVFVWAVTTYGSRPSCLLAGRAMLSKAKYLGFRGGNAIQK